jgi:hypothetical protein
MKNASDKVFWRKSEHNFMFNIFFQKYFLLKGNLEKYHSAREAIDENIWCLKDAIFVADNKGKNTTKIHIFNTLITINSV